MLPFCFYVGSQWLNVLLSSCDYNNDKRLCLSAVLVEWVNIIIPYMSMFILHLHGARCLGCHGAANVTRTIGVLEPILVVLVRFSVTSSFDGVFRGFPAFEVTALPTTATAVL